MDNREGNWEVWEREANDLSLEGLLYKTLNAAESIPNSARYKIYRKELISRVTQIVELLHKLNEMKKHEEK